MNRNNKKTINCDHGFSIIEVMISITIIMTGFVSVILLFDGNIRMQRENIDKLIAYNLAKEGVEIVRWQRDTDWTQETDNIPTCADCTLDVVPVLVSTSDPTQGWELQEITSSWEEDIYYDSNNKMYVQSANNLNGYTDYSKTKFQRHITISKDAGAWDEIKIKSVVTYYSSRAQTVELEYSLFNWK